MSSSISKFCEAFARPEPKLRKKRSQPLSALEVAIRDAKYRASSGEWESAKGATFVGLYAMCHQMVYGVVPSELTQPALFRSAARLAVKALHEQFDDDPGELAAFVRWCWEREKRRSTWAQSSGVDRNRLSWKWQFSRSMETDYRISRKRI
jgi:hypothetical protein